MFMCVSGTNRVSTLVQPRVSTHLRDGYAISFRPCTLMGFVVAIGSALRPWAYFQPFLALAHFLERGVSLDRQVSQLRLVGGPSSQRFTANSIRASYTVSATSSRAVI